MPSDTSVSDLQEHARPRTVPSTAGIVTTNDEISLLDLMIVLAERKHIIFLTTAVFATLSVIVSLVLPVRYTAIVTLLPPQQNSSMGTALSSQLGNLGGLGGMAALAGGGLGLKSPNDLYVSMFKSRTVEVAMAEHFGLMQEYRTKYLFDAGKIFESHAKVDASGKDGLIRISVDDHDPRRAAELANGYVDQFRKLSEHLAITEASQRALFFEHQLEQAKDNLVSAEEALKETQQTTGLLQPQSQESALIGSATSLRAQIVGKEVEIESLRTFATSENSQVVQAQKELESLRAQLAKLGGSDHSSDADLMLPKGRVAEAGLEYLRRYRDVKYYETLFDILARQFEAAKLDEAKQGALVQVIDPAFPPDRRSFPKRSLIVMIATACGLVFGVFFALLQFGFRSLKKNPEVAVKLHLLRTALSIGR